ncbi:MAG: DUF6152 family protein [Hyphomonadaceae bacterium]
MNRKLRKALAGAALAAVGVMGLGTAAYAHHAFAAEFDANRPVLLRGSVVGVEWVNPHTWIHIDVPDVDEAGKEKKGDHYYWAIEGGTPNTLLRTGVNRNTLKTGTEVVVRGYQSKDGLCEFHPFMAKPAQAKFTKLKTCKANGRDVTFPNGCKLFVGSSGTGAPRDGADASEGGDSNQCAAGPA